MITSCQTGTRFSPLVGLVVEGESEIGAIPQLLRDSGARLARPMKFGGQPEQCNSDMFCEFIQHKIIPSIRAMVLKNVSLVVVILDREHRDRCPGILARDIKDVIAGIMGTRYHYTGSPPISVVCTDRKLENWLIADPKGILTHKYIVRDLSRAVGSEADGKDAIALLKRAYQPGQHYHKRMDAPRLASRVRAIRPDVRLRSHSLDKLLRECGVPPLAARRTYGVS